MVKHILTPTKKREAGILGLDHNFYDHIFFFKIFLKKAYILNVFRQFTKKDDMIVKIMIKP